MPRRLLRGASFSRSKKISLLPSEASEAKTSFRSRSAIRLSRLADGGGGVGNKGFNTLYKRCRKIIHKFTISPYTLFFTAVKNRVYDEII